MNNANICRYGRELRKSLRIPRLGKRISAAFAQSLTPLLEDIPDPSYDDLVDAFGPPEHLAESLLQTMEIPQPFPRWKKLILCICAVLAVCAVCFGVFSIRNAPEEDVFFSDAALYTESVLQENYYFAASETFSQRDVDWDQPREMTAYLIVLENAGTVRTNIVVQYSDRQPPHTFAVPAGETRVFVVNDPHPGKHSIAFNTPDGTLSGAVRVLLSDAPIP